MRKKNYVGLFLGLIVLFGGLYVVFTTDDSTTVTNLPFEKIVYENTVVYKVPLPVNASRVQHFGGRLVVAKRFGMGAAIEVVPLEQMLSFKNYDMVTYEGGWFLIHDGGTIIYAASIYDYMFSVLQSKNPRIDGFSMTVSKIDGNYYALVPEDSIFLRNHINLLNPFTGAIIALIGLLISIYFSPKDSRYAYM